MPKNRPRVLFFMTNKADLLRFNCFPRRSFALKWLPPDLRAIIFPVRVIRRRFVNDLFVFVVMILLRRAMSKAKACFWLVRTPASPKLQRGEKSYQRVNTLYNSLGTRPFGRHFFWARKTPFPCISLFPAETGLFLPDDLLSKTPMLFWL